MDELIIVSQPVIGSNIMPSESDGEVIVESKENVPVLENDVPTILPSNDIIKYESTTTLEPQVTYIQRIYSFISYKDNRSLLIHIISDFILFYFFFSYIHNQFQITEQMIAFAKKRLIELRDDKKTER